MGRVEETRGAMDRQAILAQANFFRELSDDSRRALAEVCRERILRKKDILFIEGETGRKIYLLNRGEVRLSKTSEDGAATVVKMVEPGEVFAEVILFETPRYPVTAVALSDGLAFEFERSSIHALLDRKDFRNDFIAMLMRKQRYLAERLRETASRDADERLLRFLRRHCPPGKTVSMSLSKKDVAAAVGIAPETLSRLLRRWGRAGTVRWTGRALSMVAQPPAEEAAP